MVCCRTLFAVLQNKQTKLLCFLLCMWVYNGTVEYSSLLWLLHIWFCKYCIPGKKGCEFIKCETKCNTYEIFYRGIRIRNSFMSYVHVSFKYFLRVEPHILKQKLRYMTCMCHITVYHTWNSMSRVKNSHTKISRLRLWFKHLTSERNPDAHMCS